MEKNVYESPRLGFQELRLLERVADKCWGYKYGWYDVDGDGIHDTNEAEIKLESWGSCEAVQDGLVAYMNNEFGQTITVDDVKTSSKSIIVRPIKS